MLIIIIDFPPIAITDFFHFREFTMPHELLMSINIIYFLNSSFEWSSLKKVDDQLSTKYVKKKIRHLKGANSIIFFS